MGGVLGLFKEPHSMDRAAEYAKNQGWRSVIRISPLPTHGYESTPVQWCTLAGALTGGTTGFCLASFAALKYGMIVSGKPLVTVPPYLVILFEFTILFGAIFTMAAVMALAIFPNLFFHRCRLPVWHDPRLTHDHFGVFVECTEAERDEVRALLEKEGAVETKIAEEKR
ncbi:MAG: DUF3341 domain-containing protein [Candidatus Hydrogenedentota bacterium]|nr:MAG: DUF3341 domain-containing protein [Candidatus Hydrogenedentota bacterium]